MPGLGQERWFQLKESAEIASSVWSIADWLWRETQSRRALSSRILGLYSGRLPTGLSAPTYWAATITDEPDFDLNVSRSATDTVLAEIAGRQRPKGQLQTTDADWETKRRAVKLDRYAFAILQQRQGQFLNAWELMETVFSDAVKLGIGAAKVFVESGRVCIERTHAHELLVDPVDAYYGSPQNLFQIHTLDADKVVDLFVDQPGITGDKRDRLLGAIASAEMSTSNETAGYAPSTRVMQGIRVVEAWRLPLSPSTPGRHVFTLASEVLHDEPWTRATFPFVFLRWQPEHFGFEAQGLIEQGLPIHAELAYNAEKLSERFRLCGGKRTYYQEGTIKEEALIANDAEVLIPVQVGAPYPKEEAPKPVNESEVSWMQIVHDLYYQINGVSQLRASARKEPGVTAGVAIRLLNDTQTARFSLKARRYESAFVDLTMQIIEASREAHAAGEDVHADWQTRIKWSDVELPGNTYTVTIAPSSALPNDPAGRLQFTQELYSAGLISPDTFKQLLGWPDLEKELNYQTAQTRYLERVIDEMLDAPEGAYRQVAPDELLIDKKRAMLTVAQAYFEAIYDDAPLYAVQRLRDYISDLDQLIQTTAEAMAEAMAQMQNSAAMAARPGVEGSPPAPGEPTPGATNVPIQ